MHKYTVTSFAGLSLPAGTLVRLTGAQAAARAHQLRQAHGDGWYEAGQALSFKRGEEIEVRERLPKQLADLTNVEPMPSPPTAPEQVGLKVDAPPRQRKRA